MSATPEASYLEYHYYSGGLRIVPLSSAPRPDWVPPPEWAGFRDEVQIETGDFVVEFSRSIFGGNRVAWFGLYHRASDAVFGDRQNHAGVGVWLLDRDIARADLLADDLRQILGAVNPETVNALMGDIKILQSKFIPKYLVGACELPPPFGGWTPSSTPIHKTELLKAREIASDASWKSLLDQVARMSVLSDEPHNRSRAVVLVPRDKASATARDIPEIGENLIPEIMARLPLAFEHIVSAQRDLTKAHEQLTSAYSDLNYKLQESKEAFEQARAEVTDLSAQLSENDEAQRLVSIGTKVDAILRSVERTETSVHSLRKEVQAETGEIRENVRRVGLSSNSGMQSTVRPANSVRQNPLFYDAYYQKQGAHWSIKFLLPIVGIVIILILTFLILSRPEFFQ